MKIKKIKEENGVTRCECPFCESGWFFAKGEDFSCFSCGKHGKLKEIPAFLNGSIRYQFKETGNAPKMNREAALFFYGQVKEGGEGAEYLKKRGISAEEMRKFGLGYAPDSFTALYDAMKERYTAEELETSGLFRKGKDGRFYDFFRNRVMFPIMDHEGNVIAFGGRDIGGDGPKYLNSAESPVFSKKENLYGFPYKDEPESDAIFICEGYMDLIALKKAGIKDSAGVLGTAITKEHAKLIASRYKKVCLGLDSDAAGMNAIKRSASVLEAYGLTITVPSFKPAKDPDEFLQRFGGEKLKEKLQEAIPVKRFLAMHSDGEGLLDVLVDAVLEERKGKYEQAGKA